MKELNQHININFNVELFYNINFDLWILFNQFLIDDEEFFKLDSFINLLYNYYGRN